MKIRVKWNTESFRLKIKELNPNIDVIGEYVNAHEKIRCKCLLDGHIWDTAPTHLLHTGRGCPKCNGGVRKTHEEFIKQVKQINPEIKVIGKYERDNQKIKLKCVKCGNAWETKPTHIIQGHGCPNCKSSLGEKEIARTLDGLKYHYVRQKRFKECTDKYTLPFDFYIPELKTCIEYDGEQHFRPCADWGGRGALEEVKRRDKIKTEFCINQGIKLIRIPFKEKNIETKLVEELLAC